MGQDGRSFEIVESPCRDWDKPNVAPKPSARPLLSSAAFIGEGTGAFIRTCAFQGEKVWTNRRFFFLGAKKPPGEDSGSQSGEVYQPFTLPTPDWKLAIHALFLSRFPHAGRWLNQKRVSGSWRRLTLVASLFAPVRLKSKGDFAEFFKPRPLRTLRPKTPQDAPGFA